MTKRKGRAAALPTTVHRRPPVLKPDDLVVRHVEEHSGREAAYDFGRLPVAPTLQRELAEQFATRVGPEGRWRTLPSSSEVWLKVVPFGDWLAELAESPRQISELTAGIWSAWRLSRPKTTGGSRSISKIAALLRDHPRLPDATRDLMSKRAKDVKVKEVAYSPEEFERIKTIATRKIRSALYRIRENRQTVEQWRAGQFEDGTEEWLRGEALDHIARTGDIPNYISTGRNGTRRRVRPSLRHRDLLGSTPWQRLFLTGEEAASLVVLLIATYGWNAVPTAELTVPDTSPNPGVDGHTIYRVELVKRRRGGANTYETRNLTDWGAGSPGRLIAQAIELTAPAREVLAAEGQPTNRLIAWRANRVRDPERYDPKLFHVGADGHSFRNLLRIWNEEYGPGITVNLRRLRKTVVGQHKRVPTQHSQDTHDQVYVLPDPQTWKRSESVIAAGIEEALEQARTTVKACITREPTPPAQDTATTGCTDYQHSIFSEHGKPCRASFLLCTACPNAVITPRHLPKLAYLHHALENLCGVVPPAVWNDDWREPHARLTDLKTRPDFTAAEWSDALAAVSATDRAVIDDLLRNGFDA